MYVNKNANTYNHYLIGYISEIQSWFAFKGKIIWSSWEMQKIHLKTFNTHSHKKKKILGKKE